MDWTHLFDLCCNLKTLYEHNVHFYGAYLFIVCFMLQGRWFKSLNDLLENRQSPRLSRKLLRTSHFNFYTSARSIVRILSSCYRDSGQQKIVSFFAYPEKFLFSLSVIWSSRPQFMRYRKKKFTYFIFPIAPTVCRSNRKFLIIWTW